MSPLRNTASGPTQRRNIARVVTAVGTAVVVGAATLTAACSDAPTGPTTPNPASASAQPSQLLGLDGLLNDSTLKTTLRAVDSGVRLQLQRGDTTVTVLQVGTGDGPVGFTLGLVENLLGAARIEFPLGAASICDPGSSGYGPGTWNQPCRPATRPVRITARTWVNEQGRTVTEFQPALRFVPGRGRAVTLTLPDPARPGTRVDYCTDAGCVDESVEDPSLATELDPAHGVVRRPIKHFSGYTVIAN